MIIVIVPMIAVALVLFSITADSETGKADAQIAQGLRAAFAIYDEDRGEARPQLPRLPREPRLGRRPAAGAGDRARRPPRHRCPDSRARARGPRRAPRCGLRRRPPAVGP